MFHASLTSTYFLPFLTIVATMQASATRAFLSDSSLMEKLREKQFDAVLYEQLDTFGLLGTTLAGALKLPLLGIDGSTEFWNPPPGVPQVHKSYHCILPGAPHPLS